MSEILFKGKRITRQRILDVIRDFDKKYPDTNQYDRWLEKRNFKFAIKWEGKLYPPKHILSQASGINTSEFSGGQQTNSVFKTLGFTIIDKPSR